MNFVDLVVLGAIVVFAWTGWRSGFVAGLLSFLGFIVGGLLGSFLAPVAVQGLGVTGVAALGVTALLVLGLAVVGQIMSAYLGRLLRDKIAWRPAQLVDSAAGSILNIAAIAIICWMLAATAAAVPSSSVSGPIKSSRVLTALDAVVPPPARDLVTNLRTLVDDSGLPQLFDSFGVLPALPVDPPSVATVNDPSIQAALPSVVKVQGSSLRCNTGSSGSGFVFSPQHVLTNAHVVAGLENPQVVVPSVGTLSARLVYFDPTIDVAALYVPDLTTRALKMSGPLPRGANTAIAGYPGGGPMTVSAARVRGTVSPDLARGTDVYGNPGVAREVYVLRGIARPGNSGGPLLTKQGTVGGVVFAQAEGDPETAYALTAAQVHSAVEAGRYATAEVSSGPCK